MQPVSGSGPTDGENPFEGIPLFGDLGKLLGGMGGGQGGLQWDTTRQVAMQLARSGEAEQNIDPIERMDVEELARVADLHVTERTGLSTKVMNERLVKLARFGILQRQVFAEVPPRVEYRFTDFGQQFLTVLRAIDQLEAQRSAEPGE